MSGLLVRTTGQAGHITLNRPKALNALTHQMCLDLETALDQWEMDSRIALVMIDGAGNRAFCAGGDIVDIYTQAKAGNDAPARQFWRDEYRLNAKIANYAKPYVAIMDGIVMGGGVGISAHGSHRIVTERTVFAMPECAIGLMPDVGGSLLLANMPGACGEYAGLTGARLSGADCLYAGLADYFVSSEKLEALKQEVTDTGDVTVLTHYSETPPVSELEENQAVINCIFSADHIMDIQKALAESETEFAQKALKGFIQGAPLSVMAALKTIRNVRRENSLATALRREYRFVSTSLKDGEFLEGIRAMVIDKDRTPNWRYKTFDAVPREMIDRLDHPAIDGDFEF